MKNYCSNLYVFWDFYIPRTQVDIVPRLRPGSRGEGGRILRIADPALTRAQRGVTTWHGKRLDLCA